MLSHRERFLRAVELHEPDMVPLADLCPDPPLVEKITGIPLTLSATSAEESRKNLLANITFCKKLDFDAVVLLEGFAKPDGYTPRILENGWYVDEWGIVREDRKDLGVWAYFRDGTVKTPEDLENYVPLDANAPGRFERLQEAVKEARNHDLAIAGLGATGFGWAYLVRGGIDKFLLDMHFNPGFAKKLLAKVSDAMLAVSKLFFDVGVDVLCLADDYAELNGPLISPKLFREFELPYLKRAADMARKRGVPVLKHTDGNVYPILEDMVDAGINGLHPMEPDAMDIGDVKRRYGQRLFLMGNVDCRQVLPFGSEEDVRRDVRRCIDAASYGGGHILASSNTLHANCKPANVLAMVDETRKYGKYPLKRKFR